MAFLSTYSCIFLLLPPALQAVNISTDPNDIHFYLYPQKSNPDYKEEIIFNNITSLHASSFQKGQKTVFLVHGFRSGYDSEFPQNVKNEYLASHFNFNYVLVDWRKLSSPLPIEVQSTFYFLAALNVPIVAGRVTQFLAWLRTLSYISFNNVHMVGHSLGSHVSGLTGLHLQNMFQGEKIYRVTGLDPAGPYFWPPTEARNLQPSDAHFVDAIHTNMGYRGDKTQDGHADFYPNGGVIQPGCATNDTSGPGEIGVCSHRFAYKLYAASFNKSLLACNCSPFVNAWIFQFCVTECNKRPETKVQMGLYCPDTAFGQYYIETTNPP